MSHRRRPTNRPRPRALLFHRLSPHGTRDRDYGILNNRPSRPRPLTSPRRPTHTPDRSEVSIDVAKMMEQKSKSVSGLTKGIEGLFKKNKVTYAKGWGSLTSTPGEVVVAKEDGTTQTISAKNIILATGSEPAALPGVEVDEETIVTSTGRST